MDNIQESCTIKQNTTATQAELQKNKITKKTMATIKTKFLRGTVREAFRRASKEEKGLRYDAFRMRVLRARDGEASDIELAALDLCATVENERIEKVKNIDKKIVKIKKSKKREEAA